MRALARAERLDYRDQAMDAAGPDAALLKRRVRLIWRARCVQFLLRNLI